MPADFVRRFLRARDFVSRKCVARGNLVSPNAVFERLRQMARDFRSARAGNVAITFALASIPIVGMVGAAIDYSHANSVKAAMQSALDSTALMLHTNAASLTTSQLQAAAASYFTALFNRPEAQNVTVTTSYTTSGGTQVVVNASASVPTYFMGILGFKTMTVSDSATAKWGQSRLLVSLVLDNTGSMSQSNKMTELKTATNNLLTQLQNAAATNGDVYVSIVPFVVDVNVNPSNYNANWIYWGEVPSQDPTASDNTSWDANNGTCSDAGYTTRSTCTAQGSCSISGETSQSSCTSAGSCSISGKTSQSSCTSAGSCSISGETTRSSCQSADACSNSKYTTQSTCTSHGDTWAAGVWTAGVWTAGVWTSATSTPNNHNTWNGCVMDRGDPSGQDPGNYDTNVVVPNPSIMATLFPAQQYSSCPQAAIGLSYNWSAMTTLVNNMSPAGETTGHRPRLGLDVAHRRRAVHGAGPEPELYL